MIIESRSSFCSSCGTALTASSDCGGCGRKQYPNWRLAAGVVLVLDGGLLMLRRARHPWVGHWEFAGGFVEPGEDPQAAARREVAEELSVHIGPLDLLGVYMDDYVHGDDPTVVGIANLYYRARCPRPLSAMTTSAEVGAVAVFERDAPPERLAFPRQTAAVWRDHWRTARA